MTVTHRKSKTLTYRRWCDMKVRCRRHPSYVDVDVCDRWAKSFEAFLEDMGECPRGLTLDRIEGSGHYEPGNCRWATQRAQTNNRKNTKMVTLDGVTKPLTEWCDELAVPYWRARMRIDKMGWPPEKVLSKANHSHRMVTYRGHTKSLTDWCKDLGIPYDRTKARLNALKWSVERAFDQPIEDFVR